MKVEITKSFIKDLQKIDKKQQLIIKTFINEVLVNLNHPREQGKELKGKYKGTWRYRVRNYRILAQIDDEKIIIYLLRVEHRQGVYK